MSDHVIRLALRIVELRKELVTCEHELHEQITGNTKLERRSLSASIRSIIYENPGQFFSYKSIQEELPQFTNVNSIRTTIQRIVRNSKGKIVKVGKGKWVYRPA